MRLQVNKSKNAKCLYIVKTYYDENNKKSNKTVKSLGSVAKLMKEKDMSEEEVMIWAEKELELYNIAENDGKGEVIVNFHQGREINHGEQKLYNAGYIFLKEIYSLLGMNKICKEISKKYKFEYDLGLILSHLVCNRILYPGSKKAVAENAMNFVGESKIELSHIYRALDILAKEKEYIEAAVYNNSKKVIDRHTGILYYDCTNFFFEVDEAQGIKQYGKSKENRPNPIVQMGMFLDGNGLPLAFNISSGNTNEQVTLRPIEQRILREYADVDKFVVCTDAGLNSEANKRFNSIQSRSYISTESLKKQKKEIKKQVFDKKEWFYFNKLGRAMPITLDTINFDEETIEKKNKYLSSENKISKSTIFYKEILADEKIDDQRLIVTFSLPYKQYASGVRQKQIERAIKKINSNGSYKKRPHQNDVDRFITSVNITNDGEVATKTKAILNTDKIKEEEQYDGLYAVSTTLIDDVRDIIDITHRRWEIEASFRVMKSEFKSRPVYLQKDDRIIAHFLVCYLALFVYRVLENKLGKQFTVNETLNKLRNFNFYRIRGHGYAPAYTRDAFTDTLHKISSFKLDYELISDKVIKSISKSLNI